MKPVPFKNSDERDALLWRLRELEQIANDLGNMGIDPAMKPYRIAAVESDAPRLPSFPDLATAQNVLERVAVCLRHHYEQRCRDQDDVDYLRHRKPGDLNDERPF